MAFSVPFCAFVCDGMGAAGFNHRDRDPWEPAYSGGNCSGPHFYPRWRSDAAALNATLTRGIRDISKTSGSSGSRLRAAPSCVRQGASSSARLTTGSAGLKSDVWTVSGCKVDHPKANTIRQRSRRRGHDPGVAFRRAAVCHRTHRSRPIPPAKVSVTFVGRRPQTGGVITFTARMSTRAPARP
jgi:hypothetical protein